MFCWFKVSRCNVKWNGTYKHNTIIINISISNEFDNYTQYNVCRPSNRSVKKTRKKLGTLSEKN